MVKLAIVFVVACLLDAREASAQGQGQPRLAAGKVQRPGPQHPEPVAGQWVVLHRVGSDRAAPVDSARSASDGSYRIAYRTSGASDALYFVSSRYDGIAYFSPPLRADTVLGGDADVMVYGTTTDTSTLHLQGHHIVMSTPRGRRREMAEIFEIDNDGTATVVARDSVRPIWSAFVPAESESISVAPGDIGAGAVAIRRGHADVFAPISPGVRQLVLTYLLPVDAFPVSWPVQRATTVLEVLAEEPRATVEGARLAEVAPAAIEGRSFRRFLARDVPSNVAVRIDAPAPAPRSQPAMRVLAVVMALLMLGAMGFWYGRRRRASPAARTPPSEDLIAELAALDARFERTPSPSVEARGEYERERAALKARIEHTLAEENQQA